MPSHDAASPRQLLRKAWGATTRPFGMIRGHRPRAAAQREAVTCLRAYQRTGDPGYRDLAISLFEGLCAGERDDDIAFAAAADLATLRFQRYLDDGGTELLESAVAAHKDVVRRCPPGHPLRAAMLGNLASALVELNSRNPGARVLDRAVEHQSAVRMTPPDAAWRPALLVNLATAMVARYQRDGDPADLDDAAACHEELRRLGAADETVALSRADLQWERYCRSGAPGELEDVISALKEAVPRLAVAAVEAGRGLLLSEALPADDRLRVRQPDLYDRYAQAAALFAGRSTLGGLLPGGGQPLAVISRGSAGRGAQDHPAIIHSER